MINPGEIVRCNLTFVTSKKNTILINDAVFGRPYEGELQTKYSISSNDDLSFLRRHKITEDVELIKVDVIKSLGFKNTSNNQEASPIRKSKKSTK